jgi:hypothetical protein
MKQIIQPQKKSELNIKNCKSIPILYWILLLCIIAFVIFVRTRLLTTPLERDEGEYAYMGQLLLQGIPPYQEACNMKLPGTSMMYAIIMFFLGQSISAIHIGLLLVNITSILLLFFLTQNWFDFNTGIIAAASFAVFTISHVLLGFAAHATHFVVLFTLAGLVILNGALEKKERSRFFISGFLLGCAFLMKQPGLYFILFGISLVVLFRFTGILLPKEFYRFGILLLAGVQLPIVLILIIIIWSGTFNNFWFWVIQYAFEYGNVFTIQEGSIPLSRMLEAFWRFFPSFCIIILIGFFLFVTGKFGKQRTIIGLLFIVFSILALIPGWYFRNHYFILIAPVCSILVGSVYFFLQNTLSKKIKLKFFLPLLPFTLFAENIISREYYYLKASPDMIVETVYNGIFPESIVIGEFLASHTMPTERIAILGSEPQIYFYARRRSVSQHIYMYGLMEPQPYAHKMQTELIADIERTKPKYIVFYQIPTSWNATYKSDLYIARWVKEYTRAYYFPVGLIDIVPRIDVNRHITYDTRYVFGNDVQNTGPRSQDAIIIYERNGPDNNL